MILVQAGDGCIQLVHMAVRAQRRGIGSLRLTAGIAGRLVGRVRGGLSLADTRLRPAVHVLDVAPVFGVDFIQLIELALDGFHPVIDPLLACKGIDPAPEALLGGVDGDRRRCNGGGLLLDRGRRSVLGVCRWLPLLRKGGNCNCRCQQNKCEPAREQVPRYCDGFHLN
jgi:hypothetical protein